MANILQAQTAVGPAWLKTSKPSNHEHRWNFWWESLTLLWFSGASLLTSNVWSTSKVHHWYLVYANMTLEKIHANTFLWVSYFGFHSFTCKGTEPHLCLSWVAYAGSRTLKALTENHPKRSEIQRFQTENIPFNAWLLPAIQKENPGNSKNTFEKQPHLVIYLHDTGSHGRRGGGL